MAAKGRPPGEYSITDHLAACREPERVHTCHCGATASCREEAYWEEWAHIHGQILLGERSWTIPDLHDWCSVGCLIKWFARNYYNRDGVGGRWARVADASDDDDDDELEG